MKMYSFYFEAVKLLKRCYSDHPELCPFVDFGQDQSNTFKY